MFLTRMVNGLLNSNKNNNCPPSRNESTATATATTALQQQQPSTAPSTTTTAPESPKHLKSTTSSKAKKKAEKNKRIDTKKSITKFFKSSSPKESTSKAEHSSQQPGTSKLVVANNEGSSTAGKSSTKVKSASWKRSDKSNTVLTALTSKKSKGFRKKTPNLLTFSHKLDDRPTIAAPAESNSACRPGTLYSDVLFGAAPSSNLIKVKILSPRCNVGDTAQKKLTKALLKYSITKKTDIIYTNDDCEREAGDIASIFPSLNQLPLSKTTGGDATSTVTSASSSPTACSGSVKTLASLDISSNNSNHSESLTTSVASSSVTTKSDSFEEPDVVILPDQNDQLEKSESSMTYGTFLTQQSAQEVDMNSFQCSVIGKAHTYAHEPFDYHHHHHHHHHHQTKPQFRIDIPSWNFIEPDSGSDGYPKFLQQFDDDNYLKAEKLAMLSLNLALGNGPHQGHLKF